MNESTIHGNLTKDPELRHSRSGNAVVTCTVAVNGRRWFDPAKNQWVNEPSIFHTVVCFGELASHAADTLTKGMAVTVTGSFVDDSYTPSGSEYPVRRIKLRADDIAVSLRRATAVVTRVPRQSATDESGQAETATTSA